MSQSHTPQSWLMPDGAAFDLHPGEASDGSEFGFLINYRPGEAPSVEIYIARSDKIPPLTPVALTFNREDGTFSVLMSSGQKALCVRLPVGLMANDVERAALSMGIVQVLDRSDVITRSTLIPIA